MDKNVIVDWKLHSKQTIRTRKESFAEDLRADGTDSRKQAVLLYYMGTVLGSDRRSDCKTLKNW